MAGNLHSGGIEHLLPGRISGWVVGRGLPMHNVRLLMGSELIAWAEIHQPRPDVCAALGWQGQPGFTLLLPTKLPSQPETGTPRLLAVSADGSQQTELRLMQQPEQTTGLLQQLLRSELLGIEGHCDGLRQGALRGWAGWRDQKRPAQIWLQAEGNTPLSVPCDQWREGMKEMGLPEHSGFSVDPWHLPGGWSGREVWCSFDREGKFRLPQVETVMLPELPSSVASGAVAPPIHDGMAASSSESAQLVSAAINSAPEELRHHWQALEEVREYLDRLEENLDQRDHCKQESQKQAPRKAWWIPLLAFGRGRTPVA